MKRNPSSKLTIVTGAVGSGKSTWCEKIAKRDQDAGLSVVGLHSMAVFCESQKVGIDLVDLGSGERRRLAERRHAVLSRRPRPSGKEPAQQRADRAAGGLAPRGVGRGGLNRISYPESTEDTEIIGGLSRRGA